MMRVGLYRPVHVKTLRSQKLRTLLTHRKLLQSKAIAIENDLRGSLRNFGLKVGMVGMVKFEARIKELVENLPDLADLAEPLLIVRRVLREQLGIAEGTPTVSARRHHPNPAEADRRWRGERSKPVRLGVPDHHTRSLCAESPAQTEQWCCWLCRRRIIFRSKEIAANSCLLGDAA
jgi:transposase